MTEVYLYSTTTGSGANNDTPPEGWPENMDYSKVNDVGRQERVHLARHIRDANGTLTTAGTAPDYTLTLNRSSISSLGTPEDGLIVGFTAHANNGGAATTLNVNSIGAKDLLNPDGSDPIIAVNGIYVAHYNLSTTKWVLISATDPEAMIYPVSVVNTSRDFNANDLTQIIRPGSITLTIPAGGVAPAGSVIRMFQTSGSFTIQNSGGGNLYLNDGTVVGNGSNTTLSGTWYSLYNLDSNEHLLTDY